MFKLIFAAATIAVSVHQTVDANAPGADAALAMLDSFLDEKNLLELQGGVTETAEGNAFTAAVK